MKVSPFKSISASKMTLEKIVIFFLTVLILSACSGKIEIGFGRKNNQGQNSSNITLVNVSGLVDKSLVFDSSDETNFIDYTFDCAYKATSNGAETPCASYGTNSPTLDPMSVHFLWNIDSTTPNGFYSFTVKKNYSDKTLTNSFVLQVNFKAPFIVKFQLNPDFLLSINVDNSYAYDFFVDWGDGSPIEHKTSGTSFSHQYAGPATTATVTITGELPAFKISMIDPTDRAAMIALVASIYGMDISSVEAAFASYTTSNLYTLLQSAGVPLSTPAFNSKITEVVQFGSLGLKKMDYLFQGQTLLTSIGPGDLSTVESMESAFTGVGAPNPVVFKTTGWKLNNVINVKNAFQQVAIDAASDLSGIEFSNKLKDLNSLFLGARGDLSSASNWNLSAVESVESLFRGADIASLNTQNWNLNHVKNFEKAFDNMKCSSCDFSGISISTSTTNTQEMFADYDGPALINLASIDMSEVVSSRAMFYFLDFDLFPNWAQINVGNKNKDIGRMFANTTNLRLDTSSWDTSNVEKFDEAFAPNYFTPLTNVNTSGIRVTNKATDLKAMFYQAKGLTLDTSSWDTSNVETFERMFQDAGSMSNVDLSGVRVTNKATNISGMFAYITDLTLNTNFPGRVWDTSAVANMDFLFFYSVCLNVSSCDFSKVIPTIQTTSMMNTFSGKNHQLIDGLQGTSWIDDSNFPAIDTSLWNTTNVENFYGVFSRKNMAGSNLSGLSVTNKATNLKSMFDGSSNLTLDTSSWDMTSVTNADEIFSEMDASGINFDGFIPQGNISLVQAFDGVKNAVIKTSNWNLSSGANVQQIFFNGYNNKLHIDLDLANLLNSTTAFNHYGSSTDIYVLVEAGTTDPGPPTGGASYMNNTNVWCPDYAGATFMGVSCIKAPFPYP